MELYQKLYDKFYEIIERSGDKANAKRELAKKFLQKNAFRTDKYGSLNLHPVLGWIVLDLGKRRYDDIEVLKFEDEEDAEKKFIDLYGKNFTLDFKDKLMFEGIIGFDKSTGGKVTEELRNSESNLQQSIDVNLKRIEDSITEFMNKMKDDANLKYYSAYDTPAEAENDYLEIVKRNHLKIGEIVKQLRAKNKDQTLYLLDKEQWKKENHRKNHKPKFPKIPKAIEEVNNVPYTEWGFLHQWNEFFFGDDEAISIAEALDIAHQNLYGEKKVQKVRNALGGDNIIGISEDSDLIETIKQMTRDGFDMQPIINNGICVGAINLQDMVNCIAKNGLENLPKNFDVEKLEELGILLPSPPLLDGRSGFEDAEKILVSGTPAILINFNPSDHKWKTCFVDELHNLNDSGKISWVRKTNVKENLQQGIHIVTIHDISSFRFSEKDSAIEALVTANELIQNQINSSE